MDSPLSPSRLRRWRLAIFAVFLAAGLSVGTWASRVPALVEAVHVDRAELGLMLLTAGLGSLIGLSLSALIVARWGARHGMLGTMLTFAVGVAVIGVSTDVLHSPWGVVCGLVLWGFGVGATDVMMNVEGAAIEVHSGRTLLPLFHAFFSLGTVLGAGAGVAAIALDVNVLWHLAATAVFIVVVAFVSIANVPVREAVDPEPGSESSGWRARLRLALSAWKEPRTYALGVIMLGMSFAEGGAGDWLALGVVQGHGVDEAYGAAGLAAFSISMTVMRVLGGPLVDRFGRVATLRVLATIATIGLVMFILAPSLPYVFVGAVLWGAGVSLGFPLGMSAAADDPEKAAARVSATATIGYVAFLVGPPLLGLISEHLGLLNTLYILVALIVASGLASGAARPIAGSKVGAGARD